MPFPSGYFKDYTQNKRNDNEDKNTSSYEISDWFIWKIRSVKNAVVV